MEPKIVGKISIYEYNKDDGMRMYIGKEFKKILNCAEITFNQKKLIIKRASIDSRKTFSIKKGLMFTFIPREEDYKDMFPGKYNVFQLDEDTFVLNKIPKK